MSVEDHNHLKRTRPSFYLDADSDDETDNDGIDTSVNSNPGSTNTGNGYPWISSFCSESLYSYSYVYNLNSAFYSRLMVLKKSLHLLRETSHSERASLIKSPRLSQSYLNLKSQLFPGLASLKPSVSSATLSFLSNIKTSAAAADTLHAGTAIDDEIDQLLELLNDAINTLPEEMLHITDGSPSSSSIFRKLSSRAVSNPPLMLNDAHEKPVTDSSSTPGSDSPRKRTLTNLSSIHLQARLLDALATPFVDVTVRSNKAASLRRGQSTTQLYTGLGVSNSSMSSPITERQNPLAGLNTSMSMLNLSSFHGAAEMPAFNLSPLHPLSSKYATGHAVFTTDCKSPYTIFSCNDMACLAFGTSQSDMKGKPISHLVSSEALSRFQRASGNFNQHAEDEVLFCGDLFAITKLNGVKSVMSFWAKKNARGVVIWILQEVHCDKTILHISKNSGRIHKIEGAHSETILARCPACAVTESSPAFINDNENNTSSNDRTDKPPHAHNKKAKSIDLNLKIDEILPNFLHRSDNDAGTPVAFGEELERLKHEMVSYQTLQIDRDFSLPCFIRPVDDAKVNEDNNTMALELNSLPRMSGMIIIDQKKLKVCDYNEYFIYSLLGYHYSESLRGKDIAQIFPKFPRILKWIMENALGQYCDKPLGLVIPEYTLRKAAKRVSSTPGTPRNQSTAAMGSLSELATSARPFADLMDSTTIEAVSANGSLVKVDLQLRIATPEHYAIWVSYSRHLSGPGFETPSQLALLDNYLNKRAAEKVRRKKERTKSLESPASSRSSTAGSTNSAGQSTDASSSGVSVSLDVQSPSSNRVSTDIPQTDFSKEHVRSAEADKSPNGPYSSEVGAQRRTRKLDDFVILNKMGEGAYGKVLMVRYRKFPEVEVVLKCVIKERILVDTWTRDRKLGTIPNEIKILASLTTVPHENIVDFLDFFEDDKYYHIEMLPHGNPGTDLFDMIELRPDMIEDECKHIFRQTVAAVNHLHKYGIVHRDIKDENIVVDEKGRVKLIDFGSAAFTKQGPFDVFVGTIDYAAPEVLSGNPYEGKPQDVWALGILLYTLVYKENPFYNVDEIMDGDLRIPFDVSEACISLIRMILVRNIRQRPTITDIMDHEWFTNSSQTSTVTNSADLSDS